MIDDARWGGHAFSDRDALLCAGTLDMDVPRESFNPELTRLRDCLNDLASIMAVPTSPSSGEPADIVSALLDVVLGVFGLGFAYARFRGSEGGAPVEILRIAESSVPANGVLAIASARLGLDGEIGSIVVGSPKLDFPDGSERLLLDVAANKVTSGLQHARILSLVTANHAMSESERNSRLVMDSIPGFVALLTAHGELYFVNRQILEYTGRPLEELKQWGTNDTVHPEDLPRVIQVFTQSIASERPYEIMMRVRRSDGVYRWFQNNGFPNRDASGHVVRWCVLLTDADERKRAEDALRESRTFLLEVQQLSHTGGWRYDVATDIVESSSEIQRFYAIQPGEDISRPAFWFGRIHPEDRPRVQTEFERCMREKIDYQAGYRIVLPDGSIRYQYATGRPFLDDAGNLVEFMGALMDMTEHWEATTELERTSAALRELELTMSRAVHVATVGELAASIAHEVNQPLSGIITNANTCLRMLAAEPPNVEGARETARRTLRDGNRASDVIERLRALFTKREFSLEPMDLNDATREVLALSSSELQKNHVIVQSELADDLPRITGDRLQLQQVILNLLRNGSEAMGGVDDRPRQLLIKTEREDADRVRLTVRDAGVGVDPQNTHKLFDPFYTTKSGGMGIGLSVSRSIVERHHGRLWAEPNDGPGASFSFSIPLGA